MAAVGDFVTMNLSRSEDDTNDIVVHLTNADGTDANVVGWTALLSVGADNNTPLVPPKTYSGVGQSGGNIPIDMDTFDIAIGSYKYDIRVTDTVTLDAPTRVYFKGGFKVTPRIN